MLYKVVDGLICAYYSVLQDSVEEVNKMASSSQMLKGVLEGCLLAVISKGETYGYEMIERLQNYGLTMVSEGSIYPVLMRMQKEGLVSTVMRPSPNGPKRKYYSLTSEGRSDLEEFKERWEILSSGVNTLMEKGKV
ncbi:PadR family transcriptional regulator [Filibacter tadaridae]|uniref:Lineage-specific thermal regulator protein n=2 Tax=Filibacter tadaridae TaxID=2483811 RepID=A0A3P5W9G0_9BACL|nr:lineage-specific thermal regulator protein [Filibacter tadaridae]